MGRLIEERKHLPVQLEIKQHYMKSLKWLIWPCLPGFIIRVQEKWIRFRTTPINNASIPLPVDLKYSSSNMITRDASPPCYYNASHSLKFNYLPVGVSIQVMAALAMCRIPTGNMISPLSTVRSSVEKNTGPMGSQGTSVMLMVTKGR